MESAIENEKEIVDPFCDPQYPVRVNYETVLDAAEKIKGGVIRTPCTRSKLSEELEMELYFKREFTQFTGSFKDRGALYSLLNLTKEQKAQGVITTSAGNHAQALAYQSLKLDIRATVVMPVQAPVVKISRCKEFKANVILHGNSFAEAKTFAMAYGQQHGFVYINGYDHPDVLAGQGTAGIEILEDFPDAEYIIVPIGGGGLIAGISVAAKHIKPNIKIIGVESERCPSWTTAVQNGRPIICQKSQEGAKDSIADGLSVTEVGYNSFATAKDLIDKVVRVDEKYIASAILRLLEVERAVVEGGGAAGLAALLSHSLPELKGKKVACVLCGSNIDVTALSRVIDRALVMDGRLCRFYCVINDRAGGLAQLASIIAEEGASIKDVVHERMSLPSFVFKARVQCMVETRNSEHADSLRQRLLQQYAEDLFWDN